MTGLQPGQIWTHAHTRRRLGLLTVITRPEGPAMVMGETWDPYAPPPLRTEMEVLSEDDLRRDYQPPPGYVAPMVAWWVTDLDRPEDRSGPFAHATALSIYNAALAQGRRPGLLQGVTHFELISDVNGSAPTD